MSSIFGGNTGLTYEDVQRKRAMASRLIAGQSSAPRNVGEGLTAIGNALAARSLNKQASKAVADNPQFANYDGLRAVAGGNPSAKVIQALLSGAPNFARGGTMMQGGQAVVGENGPEVVQLPRGAQVMPTENGINKLTPEQQQEFMTLTPDEKMRVLQSIEGPEPQIEYEGPRDFINQMEPQQESNFIPGAEYQTAQSGQVATDAYPISPSGVGEQTQINNAVNSYRSILTGLDDYNSLVQKGGAALMPGKQKDSIDVSRRHLQMQMKELYNLGVLNGPDLELMDTILLNPNGVVNKILDVTGIADTESRVASNVELVKKLMTEMVEPKLKSMGLVPEDVSPKADKPPSVTEMSDDDLMKILTGG
jgi:hypothetical protein